jgi:hypothetical protein
MNVIFVVVTTPVVQIVLAYQMVITLKITAVLVMLMAAMTVYRIVLVHGAAT